jgi:hypothetical protein
MGTQNIGSFYRCLAMQQAAICSRPGGSIAADER